MKGERNLRRIIAIETGCAEWKRGGDFCYLEKGCECLDNARHELKQQARLAAAEAVCKAAKVIQLVLDGETGPHQEISVNRLLDDMRQALSEWEKCKS